jgi:hypothetical protein
MAWHSWAEPWSDHLQGFVTGVPAPGLLAPSVPALALSCSDPLASGGCLRPRGHAAVICAAAASAHAFALARMTRSRFRAATLLAKFAKTSALLGFLLPLELDGPLSGIPRSIPDPVQPNTLIGLGKPC